MRYGPTRQAFRATLVYLIAGALWIFFSDRALELLVSAAAPLTAWQTYKGWLFVVLTGLLFFSLARAALVRERATAHSLRALVEGAPLAIIQLDPERRVRAWNPAAEQMFGWSAHEVLGHAPPVLGKRTEQALAQRLRAGDRFSGWMASFVCRNGAALQVSVSAARLLDGNGSVLLVEDMTAHLRAEENLRLSDAVIHSIGDGVVITDLDGAILAVNRAFTDITGYRSEQVVMRNPRLLQSGRHDRAFFQGMWRQLRDTGSWQGEIWNRRADGEVYPERLTIATVRDDRGAPTHYVGVFTDLSRAKQSEQELERLAHYHPLTDLPNRLLVRSRLQHALGKAARESRRVALLAIDLDRLKTVNDSLGHPVGDRLLVEVAERFLDGLREEDTLGHPGGGAFFAILEAVQEPQAAAAIAQRLLDALAEAVGLGGGREVFVSASIGIALFPDDGDSVDALWRGAESAMYRAKEHGRSRFCFAAGDMNAEALATLELEAALRLALQRQELQVHYQPKVSLRDGRIVGAEALLRWRRPDGSAVSPATFVPLAERTGLIVAIGNWVLDAVCAQLRAWMDAGLAPVVVSINVSALQVRAGDLPERVAEAIQRHGVPPQRVELELTESVLVERTQDAIATLGALQRSGVRLALDDFGTGYSSLAYLTRFPIHVLKIDASFVRAMIADTRAAGVVNAIIALARRMGLGIVAEGVETEAQLGYLRGQGCDQMQGFLFSPAVAAEAFERLLREDAALPLADMDATTRRLLVVDDEPNILAAVQRLLRGEGYEVLTARSAEEALTVMGRRRIQVVLADQRMPDTTGSDLLARVRALYPEAVRMLLTGYTELETVVEAVNQGAVYKFLTKPWDDDQLRAQVADAFLYQEAVLAPRVGSRAGEVGRSVPG